MLARLLTRSLFVCAFFAVLGTVALTAQGPYPRIKVIEEFTSATCPPCRGATPNMEDMTKLDQKVVSIRYHMNYPQPNDPWNLFNPTEATARHNFYEVKGIPAASANGNPKLNPSYAPDVSTMKSQLAALSATTPVQITVTQNGGKIKVRVKSDIALSGHTLHVVMVTRFIAFPNVAAVNAILQGSSSNQEIEFRDIMNKMYPDQNGTALTIPAGGDQTFEFVASVSNSEIVHPTGQQYAVAFVQSNSTKQIVQGGVTADMSVTPHTFTFLTRSKVEVASTNPYQRVGRGATSEVDVAVSNKGTAPATADLSVSNSAALTQVGMSAQFEPASVTLAPNETKTVKLKVTGSANSSPFMAVNPAVAASDGLGIGTNPVYYLVDGGKVVTYYGVNNAQWALTTQSVINSTHGPDVVYMPFSGALQAAYPVTDFDAAVFAFDGGWTAIQGDVFNAIQAMEASGKGLWISGQANMYTTFEQSRNGGNALFQPVRDWYKNTLGIDYAGFRQRILSTNTGTTIYSFPVKGVAGDSIGKGITPFTANQYAPGQWETYAVFSDIMRLTATSKAKPWLYYSDSTSNIGGIRVVTSNGSRIVYSSLDFQSVASITTRNQVTQEVLNWILAKAAASTPILTLTNPTLQFGQVQVNATKDMMLPVRNSGTAPLIITNMIVEGADALSFEVLSGTSGDITIAPNTTQNISVRFAPTTAKTNYIASITFSSNSTASPVAQLRGAGVTSSVETDVVSETGALGLRLVGANPVTDASEVELRALTNATVRIVDQAGRTMATIFDGMASGTQRVALQTSMLPSGTYNVVASNGSESAVLSIVVIR